VRLATPEGVRLAVASDVPADPGDPTAWPDPPRPVAASSVADLLGGTAERFRTGLAATDAALVGPARLLPPVDGLTEVWAGGVTYQRSSQARQEESEVADVYARVYAAHRPELFLKAPAWRVCGHGEPIGIRTDSAVDVPEPELAVVCSASGEIVGLTVCDDVSSRSIEGENPLYLPQAKIYTGSCALGPGIVPIEAVDDLREVAIEVDVLRAGASVWAGRTSTSAMHRDIRDLVEHLFRQHTFPAGAILSTGTGLVPELDWTLADGDVVSVTVGGVGTLRNVVRSVTPGAFAWLTPDPVRAPA
jgi:2-dehydro-3-deoxy-D-arabinonate dehydratase